MPLIARQRSRLAVLAVLALVGSLLAVSAVPAVAAVDDTADNPAGHLACVGAAEEDAGFTDMGNSFAADAANCLVHYGISSGTGDGSTFSPDRAVTRLQMARFLARAAGPAGIDKMMVSSQGLTDLSDLSDEAQGAVDTVVSLGIMDARSDDTFDPAGIVSRVDMAVHIRAFLAKALNGPGGQLDDLQSDAGLGSDDPPFTDIDGVSFGAYGAIKDIFELGITEGTTPTTFGPDDPVSRAQMAAFITRALAHTNARPAGITAQAAANGDTEEQVPVSVSVRDEGHGVVPDALIGRITSSTPSEAFDDAGACTDKASGDCSLHTGNEATDPDGNADLQVTLPEDPGTLTVWVWTGEAGDDFDADTTDSAMLEIDAALSATQVMITDDTKDESDFLKFGDTVTYTLQVANEDGEAVAKADVEVLVIATVDDTTTSPVREDVTTTRNTHKTDAAGQIEVSFTADDPNGDATGDRITLTLDVTISTAGLTLAFDKVNDQVAATDTTTADPDNDVDNVGVIWSDAASRATTIVLGQAISYHETDANGVRNTVTATLVDQYGDPVRGVKVGLWSSVTNTDATGTTAAILGGLGGGTSGAPGSATALADSRTTNRNGVATKSYTRNVVGAAREIVGASYSAQVGCLDTETECEETNDISITVEATEAAGLSHYWATRLGVGAVSAQNLLVADTDSNTVVVGDVTAPTLATYDANDHFQVDGANTTMEAFEKALSTTGPDTLAITITSAADDAINTFSVTNV